VKTINKFLLSQFAKWGSIKSLLRDQSGQGMVEYGLIVALIAVALIVTFGLLGDEITAIFQNIVDALSGTAP